MLKHCKNWFHGSLLLIKRTMQGVFLIRDMIKIKNIHSSVVNEFRNGKFTINKTQLSNFISSCWSCSRVGKSQDQRHRWTNWNIWQSQNFATVADCRSRNCQNYYRVWRLYVRRLYCRWYWFSASYWQFSISGKFVCYVSSLVKTLASNFGNPFDENNNDLMSLLTKEFTVAPVCDSVRTAKFIDLPQYQQFIQKSFIQRTRTLNATLLRIKVCLSLVIINLPAKNWQ